MRFPLSDWIDDHAGLRHDMGSSGMLGTIRLARPSAALLRSAREDHLRTALSRELGVAPGRIVLTHGATEANAATILHLSRTRRGGARACRIAFPEYPPLFDAARWAGYRIRADRGPADIAVISQPRNPEGDLWGRERFDAWWSGCRAVVVDETFREFAGTRSIAARGAANVWTTGSFTKFFAADELKVGFVVAPPGDARAFQETAGLLYDELPRASVAGALAALADIDRVRRDVARVLDRNRAAWRAAFPGQPAPLAPIGFDRVPSRDGDRFARRCLAASILVSPGRLFGDPAGVRLGLTRPTFPRDLAAYLAVRRRDGVSAGGARAAARRPRAGRGRARAGRS